MLPAGFEPPEGHHPEGMMRPSVGGATIGMMSGRARALVGDKPMVMTQPVTADDDRGRWSAMTVAVAASHQGSVRLAIQE
jgi:hypothetical protein